MSRPSFAIELSGVCKQLGGRRILHQVSGSVSSGSVVALVGASGSGKTTLLRCMNGFASIDAGTIEIGGHQVRPQMPEPALDALRADVGMVFQDYQLFPHLSVLQNLALAPQVVKKRSRVEAEALARKWLERVGLRGRDACRPSELSGGQKQRVALARALAQEVSVLLLDEPTSALDTATRDEVTGTLRELVRSRASTQALTVLLVTHDLQWAEQLADEIWTMTDGRLTYADAEAGAAPSARSEP